MKKFNVILSNGNLLDIIFAADLRSAKNIYYNRCYHGKTKLLTEINTIKFDKTEKTIKFKNKLKRNEKSKSKLR